MGFAPAGLFSFIERVLPCLVFEDEHLLVVNKPAGVNTHAPAPHAGEGLYEWLRNREPRWASLAILHRLDKETSGLIVFGKTAQANRSLTEQFTARTVHKKYQLLTDHPPRDHCFTVRSTLVRAGEKYLSRPLYAGADLAETRFELLREAAPFTSDGSAPARLWLLQAAPLTGRTHQIRVHAAEQGLPILGDTLYGGRAARRVFLHSAELSLRHPVSGEELTFRAEPQFEADPRLQLRQAFIEPELTNAFRLCHGAADHQPGWYVERLGDFLLSQSEAALSEPRRQELERLRQHTGARGAYHKLLSRQVRRTDPAAACPKAAGGVPAPEHFEIRENGMRFELSFEEGYSVGLFLDQRENRRRLLTGYIAPDFALESPPPREVLNTFAYTCGFSVCAAQAGAHTTSLDLSKKYLDWGRRNFALNGQKAEAHDFIYGDVFDWLRRLGKKGRRFDVILLDPPTFSQSRDSGVFRVEKDYGRLVTAALPLLKKDGVLFASTNAADWEPALFLQTVRKAVADSKRNIRQEHYAPQPMDFPVQRQEPAYLKTVWLRVA